jgi:diguanylate cyclase (GGDEF)-like protein/PAS domain S-box-containing protein
MAMAWQQYGRVSRRLATGPEASERLATPQAPELLSGVWAALTIARENKALLLVQAGTILNTNLLAAELCARPVCDLRGCALTGLLPAAASPEVERWETTLSRPPLAAIPVEVTRQPLQVGVQSFEVYAIRDLRERRTMAEQLERQGKRLRQQEEDLNAQHAKLDAALSNMFQGLAMFDADQRVIIANDRFAEMYGQTPNEVRPGTTLRAIIEHRIATGLYVGTSVDEVLTRMRERVARQKVSHMTARMGDGRTIAVSIMPRPDGGWVTTHQDISEREKLSERLEIQNEVLKAREAELAAQNARFETAINNMSQGLCLFDADQRIVIANRRYADIYGLSPESVRPETTLREILAARTRSGLYDNLDSEKFVREGLASFREKRSQIVRLADDRVISVVRVPMPDGGLVSTHEDITERERLNARLAEQHVQLDAMLENMLQGVAMFDAEQRLIVCNKRYAEMYALTPEQVRPGTTIRQILEHRIANGVYHVSDSEGFVNSWTNTFGDVSSRIQELADGRVISVTRRSMPTGGRLITHEDVTERQRMTSQLEQQHLLLKEHEARLQTQNLQLDAALNNMVQGLAMFDAEQRLILCNRRYVEIYGLTPAQVTRGTSLRQIIDCRIRNGLHSDKSPDEIVDAMLRRLADASFEQFYSELSDGRCIAITVQAMADGGTVTTHQDITDQRRSEAKITHMALHDALTGLPNRVLLNDRLEHALARGHRGEIVATHMLDLDHFKHVNDTFGHQTGDKLLQMVTERLRSLVRETDTVARMGGDEFAVVQVGLTTPGDATVLAHRIIEMLSAPYQIETNQVVIGTSVGIAIGLGDGMTPELTIRNADLALYRAKADGRGTYRFFEHEMNAEMQARHALETDLRRALLASEFELYYQPLVNLAKNEISGLEALIRWRHPDRGMVAPSTFIPLAEEIGLIVPIGAWAIREACATAARWPSHVKIAVNLSPVQFRSPDLLETISNALTTSGLQPERLELEITETILLHDSESTLDVLYQLRTLGVRIAMDDFGTGYSSLAYLQRFPFDKIKIDRSFIKDIAESMGSLNIVRAVAALAHGLGIVATAEGVETQEQLDMIRAEGCSEMQGFLFSRPLPAEEIERTFFCGRNCVSTAA